MSGASRVSVICPCGMRVALTTVRCSEWLPLKSEDATTISLPTGQSPTPSPRTRMSESPARAVFARRVHARSDEAPGKPCRSNWPPRTAAKAISPTSVVWSCPGRRSKMTGVGSGTLESPMDRRPATCDARGHTGGVCHRWRG